MGTKSKIVIPCTVYYFVTILNFNANFVQICFRKGFTILITQNLLSHLFTSIFVLPQGLVNLATCRLTACDKSYQYVYAAKIHHIPSRQDIWLHPDSNIADVSSFYLTLTFLIFSVSLKFM